MRGPFEFSYGGPDYQFMGALVKAVPDARGSGKVRHLTVWYPGMTTHVPMPNGFMLETVVPQPY